MNEVWEFAPRQWKLAKDEVHVWSASLDQPDLDSEKMMPLLSEDERERARRYRVERARRRFIAARGLLRRILACYVGVAPEQLVFLYNSNGKPSMAPWFEKSVCFNLSHSGGRAVYAVTCGREVGIDVEEISPIPEAEEIAVRFLSEEERLQL